MSARTTTADCRVSFIDFFWYFLQILAKSELNIIGFNVTAFGLWYYNWAGFHVVAKKCKKRNCLRHVYHSCFTRREGKPRKRVTLALALTRRVYKAGIGNPTWVLGLPLQGGYPTYLVNALLGITGLPGTTFLRHAWPVISTIWTELSNFGAKL